MSFLPPNESDPFYFDFQAVRDLGKDLAPQYAAGDPFPHIVIDDFLPAPVVDYVIDHFPRNHEPDGMAFNRDQERYKKNFHPDFLEPRLRGLFYSFNSRPFIRVVENITGIKGLVPDPYFIGGGFHEIAQGGHLSVHADFNHHTPLDLERRVNLLVYLNRDWQPEYGGQLELWTTDMKRRAQSIVPLANRCAIFTTTQESMHGNPEPVSHPDGRSRRSIALYYYTATWSHDRQEKTTQFRPRPGTADRRDWVVKANEVVSEYLPPALSRRILGAARRAAKVRQ